MQSPDALPTEPYKGVRDFYPENWSQMQRMFGTLRSVLVRFGYEEYAASPLERAELYENKTSEEIVAEQTYTFTDRGDRRVTLRPEMTPTLARMVAHKRHELIFPLRWFSFPNVFRYERPQRGRLREHYQLNADILGVASQEADVEIIHIAYSLLKEFGAQDEDFVVRVNTRPLLLAAVKASGLTDEEAAAYFKLVDRKDKMLPEAFEIERTAFRQSGHDPLERIELNTDASIATERALVDQMLDALRRMGVTNVQFDPSIVRGFTYYTGMVFEVFDADLKNARSLFGGGRYDNLVSAFGGSPISAVGFGMGDVTLTNFLETHAVLPVATSNRSFVYLGVAEEASDDMHAFAAMLREKGITVVPGNRAKSVGDQVKEAVRRNIAYFIAFGKRESDTGMVSVKELETRTETLMALEEVAPFIIRG